MISRPERIGLTATATAGGTHEVPQTEIASLRQRHHDEIDALESAIAALGARLNPVLSPTGLNEAQAKTQRAPEPRPVLSPLGDTLQTFSDRVRYLQGEVQGLLNTLAI